MNLPKQLLRNDLMIGLFQDFENVFKLMKELIDFCESQKLNVKLLYRPNIEELHDLESKDFVCVIDIFPSRELYHFLTGKVKKILFLVIEGGKDKWCQTVPHLHP